MADPTSNEDAELDRILGAVQAADRRSALDLSLAAWRRGNAHPLVLMLASEALEERGEQQHALSLLRAAGAAAPDEPEIHRRHGVLAASRGLLDEARAAFDRALALQPDNPMALMGAGAARFQAGDFDGAETAYRRACALHPAAAEPWGALAALAARRGRSSEARELAAQALARDPRSVSAHMALARSDLADGLTGEAVGRTSELLARTDLDPTQRVGALDLRAEALDLADRPQDAFADYQARNAVLETLSAPRFRSEMVERRSEQARRLQSYFARTATDLWAAGPGPDEIGDRSARGHAFLLGFPRSGTTLLERALAGHPAIVTLPEIDALAEADSSWFRDERALDELARLTPAQARSRRRRYWRAVEAAVGEDFADKLVLDKMPLHTLSLPLIAKLFPDARILFAVRDPRDVVFSCFRRRFQLNAAMYEFLDLQRAADFYDQVMSLAQTFRSSLSLRLLEVRHEAVLADFEGEMTRILAFLGLDWAEDVAAFAGRAGAAPRTPSDLQLARGLNRDGVGQWRRYQDELGDALNRLQGWALQLGYPP